MKMFTFYDLQTSETADFLVTLNYIDLLHESIFSTYQIKFT